MSKMTFVLASACVAVTAMCLAASSAAMAGPHAKSTRVAVETPRQTVTVTHKHRVAKHHSRTQHTHVTRRGRDVLVDAPTTTVETRGRRVAVDAPFAHVRRSTAGVYVRAPFVDLWVPRH